jgi:hypothetical protein
MRFHFIGTGYAPPPLGVDTVLPMARQEGVADFVREHRYRVPYFDALHYLSRAQALVAIGSDDPSYSASKVFPFILARRPLLLVYHQASPVLSFAEQVGAGVRVAFGSAQELDAAVDEAHHRWFLGDEHGQYAPFNEQAFAPFTAEALTSRLAAVFDTAIKKS